MNTPYFEKNFIASCDRLAEEIKSGCGLSYELYQRRLSTGIENLIYNLPEQDKDAAFSIARRKYDYMNQAETKEMDRDLGLCSHGFEPYYCPCGCGDIDEY